MTPALILRTWRRRWWRADPVALSTFDGLSPIVVVTGASEGIGAAFAQSFARAGRDVLLIARHADNLEALTGAILRAGATARVLTLAVDITAADAVQVIDRKLSASGGYADILVNNAGMGLAGPFASSNAADIETLVAVNVAALTRLCRHVLPDQLLRGRGGIINVASVGAYVPGPQQAAYYASKAYVLSLSEALSEETSGRGVHVMAVAPGAVETAFHAKMGADGALYRLFLPAMRPEAVAARAILGFGFGQRVAIPGIFNRLLVTALRVLPHRLTTPLIGLLLRPGAPVQSKTSVG